MSRPRLQTSLLELFEHRDEIHLAQCIEHSSFEKLASDLKLTIPVKTLSRAFTHTSFSHEYQVPHQEQLEFLGDSVLQLILTDELYRRTPDEKEGRLSKLRSSLVNEKALAQMASSLNLQEYILVGRGEFKKELFNQETVLADTFEALLGVIYLHQGFDFTRTLFLGWLKEFHPDAFNFDALNTYDAKSKLQEKSLAKFKNLPRYSADQIGDHFKVSLWINEEVIASGVFSSKKIGEKELAQNVLDKGLI